MATLRTRTEQVGYGETIQLRVQFRNAFTGEPADLDSFPTLTIVQPSGNVFLGPTSQGVFRVSTGLYGYDLPIMLNATPGVWNDLWSGSLDGYNISGDLLFVVTNTNLPAVNTDGYINLGDDPGFCYSQTAIRNINVLIKTLRARLDSRGKATVKDEFGNDILIDCDIYSVEQLTSFLANSISLFNEIPHFTFYTFEDTEFIKIFHDVIVQGATLMALASKSLLERGREFQFNDNGISFTPPTVSELMNTQWSTELNNHWEKVKLIKSNLKPQPLGLGTLTISTSRHPAIQRLRHLRSRQIY
jgi:hypothetical protein